MQLSTSYIDAVNAARDSIFASLSPKSIAGQPMSGVQLAELLRDLVNALNSEMFTEVMLPRIADAISCRHKSTLCKTMLASSP